MLSSAHLPASFTTLLNAATSCVLGNLATIFHGRFYRSSRSLVFFFGIVISRIRGVDGASASIDHRPAIGGAAEGLGVVGAGGEVAAGVDAEAFGVVNLKN